MASPDLTIEEIVAAVSALINSVLQFEDMKPKRKHERHVALHVEHCKSAIAKCMNILPLDVQQNFHEALRDQKDIDALKILGFSNLKEFH